ncbi:MFS transporter [Salinirubrum litoreum]|uniref:MFS transporter n=1 Tax=Salinirubrum litoreum TaxID=1126234 RepID=A0ABD5RAC3_9EURY|nr:MFS transporter [Salinirubrum litoreum]
MVFLVNLARIVFAPLVKELIAVFQITEGTAGLIATLVWVGSALPRIPTGILLTYVARHRVVIGTGGVLTGASVFTASANSVPMLAAGALLMGLSSGVYFVAANPLVSELYPERVGRALGVHGTASQLAAVAAAPVVTLALLVDWRWAFRGIGVAAALVTVVLFLATRNTTLPQASVDDRDLLGALRQEWRIVLLGIVFLGSTGFVWQGLFNFYELYAGTKGLSGTAAKNTVTLVFAAGVPAFFFSGRLADRLPHVPYILAILTAFVGSVLALTRVEELVPVLAVTVVIGYVIHSLFPAMDTFLLDSLPDETRGSAYAVYSGGMMLVQATGSVVVGTLVDSGMSYDAVFTRLAFGLGAVVVLLVLLQVTGRLDRSAATAE